MPVAFQPVEVTRVNGGVRVAARDHAATEEPLEIRLHGRPFAVIMRTPGADRELAAGFLLSERVLASADDLGTLEYCTISRNTGNSGNLENPWNLANPENLENRANPANLANPANPENLANPSNSGNVVNVTLANVSAAGLDRILADRRQITTNSSCGMCGRLTIDSLRADRPALMCDWTIARAIVASMPDRLRAAQTVFEETGGLHAAGLFTADGQLHGSAEDVGRHNAVDKVIGRMLMREALPLSDYALFVSGRTSFEIVQKALFGGIPIVASVSAPSSLAIELAEEAGITLVGFVRGERFNIYSHPERIE
jgi:FdhD protein